MTGIYIAQWSSTEFSVGLSEVASFSHLYADNYTPLFYCLFVNLDSVYMDFLQQYFGA